MRLSKILPLLVLIVVFCCGCTLDFADESNVEYRSYESANGYSMQVPAEWQENELSDTQVEFIAPDDQISLTVSSEFGGVDYFSMKEIKEQLTEKLGNELFAAYDIAEDEGGTKYFRRVLQGTDINGAKLVVDIYANQPFLTMRHYLLIIASAQAYKEYTGAVEDMIASFTSNYTEDEYLQLMKERRNLAAQELKNSEDVIEQETDEQAEE